MAAVEELITEHMDVWTSTVKRKPSVGRGGGKKIELYGVKKLRELILDLAVRGLLVPQDAEDEPASVLLERIAAEKVELVATKSIKKQKLLPEISEGEKPFSLPINWGWARLDGICFNITSGSTPPKSNFIENAGVPYLKVYNIREQKIDFAYKPQFIDNECHENKLKRSILLPGDVVMNIVGPPLGKTAIVSNEYPQWNCNQAITFFRPITPELNQYIYTYIKAGTFLKAIELIGTAGQDNISVTKSRSIVLPTPPLEEQHRIVAKVDELMALCDQLEQQSEASLAAHQTLVETLLNVLTQSASSAPTSRTDNQNNSDTTAPQTPFEQAWHRIAAHFDTLFTTEHSIEQLKQTILQLAVMGKLVPQDPSDEPASELLKRIAAEKAELVKAKKIKKQKALPEIGEDEKPFELPDGWEWSRIGDIYDFLNGFAFKSEWFSESGVRLLRNINIGHGATRWENSASIPIDMAEEFERFQLAVGDIVITLDRPLINTGLKYAIISEEDLPSLLLQRVAKFHSIGDFISTEYLARWLESRTFMESIDPGRSNGVPHISTKQLEVGLFPVCDLSEQHRIVAKVDKLMALCDQLKARLAAAQNTQLQLADAVTEQAIA